MTRTQNEVDVILKDLNRRRRQEFAKLRAQEPKSIRDIIAKIMLRRGYGRILGSEDLTRIWQEAVGEIFAAYSRPGVLKRGVLHVVVSHSVIIQEMLAEKKTILKILKECAPELKIRDLRFRTGRL